MKKSLFVFLASSILALNSYGAVVAVVDSGADIEHKAIAGKIWKNTLEVEAKDAGGDEDNNGLIDDFFGFNFTKMNNVLINKEDFGLFDQDVKTLYKFQYFYELYSMGHNLFTKELANQFNEMIKNSELMQRSQVFGGFAHGTHVAGIIAQDNSELQLITIKGLSGGTQSAMKMLNELVEENKEELTAQTENTVTANLLDNESFKKEIEGFADTVADSMIGTVTNAIIYSAQKNARVLNASLGSSLENIAPSIAGTFGPYGATEKDIIDISNMILDAAIAKTEANLKEVSPNTLLVIAAGNSSANNDIESFSPANVQADNSITVAATFDRISLASFSNYGATKVHVAAPGVGINSSIPGGDYVYMNGTSQAAPFVSRVASKIVDANTALSSLDIKTILMGTVDKKDFLKGKVISEGIVNEDRAILAAEISRFSTVEESILLANAIVPDVEAIEISSIKSVGEGKVKLGKLKTTAVQLPTL